MAKVVKKSIKAKMVNKHALEKDWLTQEALVSYIPEQGQVVIYDAEVDKNGDPDPSKLPKDKEGKVVDRKPFEYARQKVGDGIRTVGDLPFSDASGATYSLEVGEHENGAKIKLIDKTIIDIEEATQSIDLIGAGATSVLFNAEDGIVVSSTDTKVTSVGNHYKPTTGATLTPTNTAQGSASFGTTNVITDVSFTKDAAGHIISASTKTATLPYVSGSGEAIPNAGKNYGLVKSGGDTTIDDGIITINGNTATNETIDTKVSITQSNTNTTFSIPVNNDDFIEKNGSLESHILGATAYGVKAKSSYWGEYYSDDNNTLFGHGDPSEISIPLEQLIRGYRDYDKATIDIQGLDSHGSYGPFEIFMYTGDWYSKEAIFANDLPIGLHPDKWERIQMQSREMGGGNNKYICYYYTLGTSWDGGYISNLVVRREYLSTGKIEYPEGFGIVGDKFCIPIENTPETSVHRYFILCFTYDYEVTGATRTFTDYEVTRYFETGISSDGITPYVRFNEPTPEEDDLYEIKEYSKIYVDTRTSLGVGGYLNTGGVYPYFNNLAMTNIMPVIGNTIKPVENETYYLGTAYKQWKAIYAKSFIGTAQWAKQDTLGRNIVETYAEKAALESLTGAVEQCTTTLSSHASILTEHVEKLNALDKSVDNLDTLVSSIVIAGYQDKDTGKWYQDANKTKEFSLTKEALRAMVKINLSNQQMVIGDIQYALDVLLGDKTSVGNWLMNALEIVDQGIDTAADAINAAVRRFFHESGLKDAVVKSAIKLDEAIFGGDENRDVIDWLHENVDSFLWKIATGGELSESPQLKTNNKTVGGAINELYDKIGAGTTSIPASIEVSNISPASTNNQIKISGSVIFDDGCGSTVTMSKVVSELRKLGGVL